MDEKEGPFKIVALMVGPRERQMFKIVEQTRDTFLREVVPDAGTGSDARLVCNLLNKDWREKRAAEAFTQEVLDDLEDS